MNRLYLIAGVLLAFALTLGAVVHSHDVRIRAEERARAAVAHADSVDAELVPLQRALHDSIVVLHRIASRDSAAAMASVTQWARVAHPAPVVVRVDTLLGRVDTVFADAVPKLPDLIRAGDASAEKCTAAIASCAQRAVVLERDTTVMSRRIAALEAVRGSVTPPRSCTVPTIVGGLLSGAAGYVVGRRSR